MRVLHNEMIQYVDSLFDVRTGFCDFTPNEIKTVLEFESKIRSISLYKLEMPFIKLGKKAELLGIDLVSDIFVGLKVPPYFSYKSPFANENQISVSF